ncbi:hypothetical protein DZC73_18720 [Albitalea terrae]|uniref:Uncharacterized protein n=2 Tax=Piscinibacter terrae TaxID=2496871 RepID=A0A3N7HQU6_9BURK|nr:hypothetical protein DZC73_18720 [Albitalea terrae]
MTWAGYAVAQDKAPLPPLKDGWSRLQLETYTSGCTLTIMLPARRDYAAAAERSGNPSPKPFPEEQLRASVEPMCACLGLRAAQTWTLAEYMVDSTAKSKPFIEEAIAGGQCKPEGILGEALAAKRPKKA